MNSERIVDTWDKFRNGEQIGLNRINDLVMSSWRRCREYNIDSETPVYRWVAKSILREARQKNATLLTIVKNVVESIMSPAYEKIFNVVLATSDGIIIYKHPALSIQNLSPTMVGMIFKPDRPDASAVSACIIEHTPIIFSGAEHYCRAFHNRHCHAIPILDYNNNFIAILSISTNIKNRDDIPHFLPSLLANHVESLYNLCNIKHEYEAFQEITEGGFAVLDNDYSVQSMNSKAKKIFDIGIKNINNNIFFENKDNISTILEKNGDFINKPITINSKSHKNTKKILLSHKEIDGGRHVLNLRLKDESGRVQSNNFYPAHFFFSDIEGKSSIINDVIKKTHKFVNANAPILICGETGTGKELLASAIHNASYRADKPFMVVNCGALPGELIASELFGYNAGAFTGASQKGHTGKLEAADGGTLFLDEIGELPLDAQALLLRFLQDHIITRIGSHISKKIDIRVISATNRDLRKAVNTGIFRLDLFHRLNAIKITLPPLRERVDDILPLADKFMHSAVDNHFAISMASFTQEAKDFLCAYSWPGNIRELQNAMERLVLGAENSIVDLDSIKSCLETSNIIENDFHGNSEKEELCSILKKQKGNMRKVAEVIGCSRSTLYYKLHKYGIDFKRFR